MKYPLVPRNYGYKLLSIYNIFSIDIVLFLSELVGIISWGIIRDDKLGI